MGVPLPTLAMWPAPRSEMRLKLRTSETRLRLEELGVERLCPMRRAAASPRLLLRRERWASLRDRQAEAWALLPALSGGVGATEGGVPWWSQMSGDLSGLNPAPTHVLSLPISVWKAGSGKGFPSRLSVLRRKTTPPPPRH